MKSALVVDGAVVRKPGQSLGLKWMLRLKPSGSANQRGKQLGRRTEGVESWLGVSATGYEDSVLKAIEEQVKLLHVGRGRSLDEPAVVVA